MGRASWTAKLAILIGAIALTAITPVKGAGATISAAPSAALSGMVGELNGVAAVSASNIWAVGYSGGSLATYRTLILHWNSSKWSAVTNPKPMRGILGAVTVVSATDAWAVGVAVTAQGTNPKALVMHWNGQVWRRQTGAPGVAGSLSGVAATSKSVWAVGGTIGAPALTLQLTGGRWYVVPTAAFANATLSSVVIMPGGKAWADGTSFFSNSYHGLLVHWNGTMWKSVKSSLQGPGNVLYALGAGPNGTAWAVGDYWSSVTTKLNGTSMLWNGKTWRNVPVPAPHSNNEELFGVIFIPGGTAWAVGRDNGRSVILHWTGSKWIRGTSPNLGSGGTGLYSVTALSARNAWAVGFSWAAGNNVPPVIAILHWNGKTWS
jgi:hypothetical protein